MSRKSILLFTIWYLIKKYAVIEIDWVLQICRKRYYVIHLMAPYLTFNWTDELCTYNHWIVRLSCVRFLSFVKGWWCARLLAASESWEKVIKRHSFHIADMCAKESTFTLNSKHQSICHFKIYLSGFGQTFAKKKWRVKKNPSIWLVSCIPEH